MEKIKSLFRNNRKLTIGLIAILALSLPFVVNQVLKEQDIRQGAQSIASISLNFSPATKQDLKIGDTFVVTLKLNAGTYDIGALSYKLNYDSSKLEFTDGTTPSNLKILTKSAPEGSYSPTYFNPLNSTVTGNGIDIHTYTFKAKANGEAKISLSGVTATAKGVGSYVPVENEAGIMGKYTIGTTLRDCSKESGRDDFCYCENDNQCTSKTCGAIIATPPAQNTTGTKMCHPAPSITVTPTISVCEGKTMVWRDSSGSITRSEPYSCTEDTCQGYRCVNGNEISPACYNESECPSACTTGVCVKIKQSNTTPTLTPTAIPVSNTPIPTPHTDICTAEKNRHINCVCTENTQCRSGLCSSGKCLPAPTDTIPQGNTGLKFSVKIPGIGQKLVNNEDNQNPINSNRLAFLQIFNDQNGQLLEETTVGTGNSQTKGSKRTIVFNTSNYNFEGQIDLGAGFTTGSYTVKLALDNTLRKQLGGIVSITAGKADNAATLTPLTPGDLNQDNTLGVFDWTYMIACIKNEASCTADIRALADLNDNGEVDEIDVQLLQRGFAVRNGD